MSEFFRFPATPYLWRPEGVDVREDKVLADLERADLLSHPVHVEEKVDGENIGISSGEDGLMFQARGSYVTPGGKHFHGLEAWAAPRRDRLARALGDDLIIFGEWCAVTHSVYYDALPDWLLVFDIYQRSSHQFWPIASRNGFAGELGLHVAPFLAAGHLDEEQLRALLGRSRVGHQRMEGAVVRTQSAEHPRRAKIVRPEFVQHIVEHWSSRPRSMNRLAGP